MGQKAVNLVNSLDNFELVAGMSPTATNDPQNTIYQQGLKFIKV